MADSSTRKSGCLGKLLMLILVGGVAGLGAALYFITQPQDLSDIAGYGRPVQPPARDLKAVLKQAIDRGYAVTISEGELNQWLGHTLKVKQGGLLASQVSLERVWVRFEEGVAEIIMERKVMGRPFTVSMFVRVEQIQGSKGVESSIHLDGGPYHPDAPNPPRGGRLGKLVVPQGFLHLLLPAYRRLGSQFDDEKQLGLESMARIRIENNRLVLDPREPTGSHNLPF